MHITCDVLLEYYSCKSNIILNKCTIERMDSVIYFLLEIIYSKNKLLLNNYKYIHTRISVSITMLSNFGSSIFKYKTSYQTERPFFRLSHFMLFIALIVS